jgi:hypothetical protein
MHQSALKLLLCLMSAAILAFGAPLVVTQTTDTTALAAALGTGVGGLTIDSVSIVNGADVQFGTYTGFDSPPVTIGDGIVLSSGNVEQVYPSFNNGVAGTATTPSTNTGVAGTAEFDGYGAGRIENFASSNDVAAIEVAFTLAAATQVTFDFVFGSVEYPQYTSNYTDAFLAFLDGLTPADQIVFDGAGNPVQVGVSFASLLTTADTNTAFADPHGLLRLQTRTLATLAAGSHTLRFEIGDVNDHILDSAVFISNLRGEKGGGGTGTPLPEPGPAALLSVGIVGGLVYARRRRSA